MSYFRGNGECPKRQQVNYTAHRRHLSNGSSENQENPTHRDGF